MNAQFWRRTTAAIGLAAVPLGLYYAIQNMSGLGNGVSLIVILMVMVAAILGPVLWVKRNVENQEYPAEPESVSED